MKSLNHSIIHKIRRPHPLTLVEDEKNQVSSRFKIMNEEISFWEDEAAVFQKMVRLGKYEFSQNELNELSQWEDELDYLVRKVFPGYRNLLTEVAQSADGQAELKRLEKRQEKLRHNYHQLKKRLLPFLPLKTKLIIW
jgi:DNA repair exonuclease SbcCD ATPase subunit